MQGDDDAPTRGSWFLKFQGPGSPWGVLTHYSARAAAEKPAFAPDGRVITFTNGASTMSAMRDALEEAVNEARENASRTKFGERGHVYITDWAMDALRDLYDTQAWIPPEHSDEEAEQGFRDPTVLGLLFRLMGAGIRVRVMLWEPTTVQGAAGFKVQAEEHWRIASKVQEFSDQLKEVTGVPDPMGVVVLDSRVSENISASHHQKSLVIRVGALNVAFCGGVDLAFTRRSAPDPARIEAPDVQVTFRGKEYTYPDHIGVGDWQSGFGIPGWEDGKGEAVTWWPRQHIPVYVGSESTWLANPVEVWPTTRSDELVGTGNKTSKDVYGTRFLQWHDQHLLLEGEAVALLEGQFCDRWSMYCSAIYHDLGAWSVGQDNRVTVSDVSVIGTAHTLRDLPDPADVEPVEGHARVQMWRTIARREDRPSGPFSAGPTSFGGEYTIAAGLANAVRNARQMICIFDQYFWSVPLARLIGKQMQRNPSLRVMIFLPPYPTDDAFNGYFLRSTALHELAKSLNDPESFVRRLGVFGLWNPVRGETTGSSTDASSEQYGIYCHAKAQLYDDALLVCGSANLNRRSLFADSELDCAVLHRETVRQHYERLLNTLFPTLGLNDEVPIFDRREWGEALLESIRGAYNDPEQLKYVILDPSYAQILSEIGETAGVWQPFPNGRLVENIPVDPGVEKTAPSWIKEQFGLIDTVIEPSSLPDVIDLEHEGLDLAEIVEALRLYRWNG